jgi:hypothetical protein
LPRDPWWNPYETQKFEANLDLMDVAYFGKNRKLLPLTQKLVGGRFQGEKI